MPRVNEKHRLLHGPYRPPCLHVGARTEAAAAVCYWWGVSHGVVQRWRRELGVTRMNNARTHQLMLEACQAGADAVKEKEWTEEELQAKRETAERLDLGRHIQPGYHGEWWSEKELNPLGKLPDAEVARRTGRTPGAVRIQRQKLGIANPASPHWTDDELALLGTLTDEQVAARTRRTAWAVYQKRNALGIPPARGTGRKRRGGAAS